MRSNFCAARRIAVESSRRLFVRIRLVSPLASLLAAVTVAVGINAATPNVSFADENGVSFWIPGFFGSLAATPQQPGWSFAAINYDTNVSASGNVAVSKEITIGQFNPAVNANISANVAARVDLGIFAPSYVFATPFLGGQASASLLMSYGNNNTSLNATAAGTLGPIPFTRSIALEQDTTGLGDLIPQFAVRWNAGVNNYMAYVTGDIPVGLYNSSNLANLGLGHGAVDGGIGYTYFDQAAGHEFSVVTGLTGKLSQTPRSGYTNGIDWHSGLGLRTRNSSANRCWWAWSATSTISSRRTVAVRRSCAPSSRVSSALDRRLGLFFRSAACRAISI